MSHVKTIEVEAVLFDMDGTLIDSGSACARIWGRWAVHYGLDAAEVIHQSHGRRPEDTALSILGPEADIQAAVALFTREEAKEKDIKTIPGAKALIDKLPQDKWAIVTSSTENVAKERLQYCGIPEPKALITGEKVSQGKPDPEGYIKAAQILGAEVKQCVVIEDALGGIEAGHRAGAQVIVVATTYPPEQFPEDTVLNNLENIDVSADNGKIRLSFTPVWQFSPRRLA